MKIHWQSFLDADENRAYMDRLSAYLNGIAAPGTQVHVAGISPPDRDFGRLNELRCAVLAIDNAIQAEKDGFDACVIGHFQEPGLYDMRAALTVPVIGVGEATMYAALQLGRQLGLVTLDPAFETWHFEQADLYGIGSRVRHVVSGSHSPADYNAAFAGDEAARRRLLDSFAACAAPMVHAGADVIVPAGVLSGLLIGGEPGFTVEGAPVINCASVGLKTAEMWVALHRIDGVQPNRTRCFALAPERARDDFQALIRNGRNG